MANRPPEQGYYFVGPDNNRNDIYPAISAKGNLDLQQPGKIVLVTGAGRGIGRAIAQQYAYAGVAGVVLCARTASELDKVEEEIKAINSKVRVYKHSVDVSSEEAVAALARSVTETEGRLDVIVNNAGHSAPWVPIAQSKPDEWWRTLEVNLKGPYLLVLAFLPLLTATAEKTGQVDVVNISSIGSLIVMKNASAYQISKAALNRLTEFLHVEHKKKGINAFAVNPGGVKTVLAQQEIETLGPFLNDTPDLCGGFTVWLTATNHNWLSGRYVSSTWDVDALTQRELEIVAGDKLRLKMVVD